MKKISSIFGILLLCLAVPVMAAEKITICHATGHDDTTHFVTLEISESAVYGPAGHFEEDGTPQAGHEGDYMGACAAEPGTTTTTVPSETTTTEVVTPTTAPEGTTTTTLPEGEEPTTTTTEVVTPTTAPEGTTTTTLPEIEEPTTTTTLPQIEEPTTTTTLPQIEEPTTTTTLPQIEELATTTTAPEGTTTTQPQSQEPTTTTTEALRPDSSVGGGLTITVQAPLVEEASVVAGLTVTEAGQTVADTQQVIAVATIAGSIITGLPFTGIDSGVLALIALALALAGTLMLKSASIEVSPKSGVAQNPQHLG